jgi:hypothetical protein
MSQKENEILLSLCIKIIRAIPKEKNSSKMKSLSN